MVDHVKIDTPKGGTPTYVFIIGVRDNILGSVTFTNKNDYEIFNENFNLLYKHGFSSIKLDIDTDKE